MSTFVKHQSSKPKGVKLAIVLGAVWLILLAVMWVAYRNSEGTGGGFLNFIGRFHILIVHLPIGVIFLGTIMEVLSRFAPFTQLKASLPFVHWIAFIGAIGATLVGYLLMSVEGFAGRAMDLHLYFGLSVVVTTFFAVFFALTNKALLSAVSIFAAAGMSMASGHFGGAMVHEGDYLVEHAPEPLKPFLLLGLESSSDAADLAIAETEETEVVEVPLGERLVYADFVVPVLEAKCNECHNENKIKGKLRMDTHEMLMAGGEASGYPTVIPGEAEDSEMIVRVTLPEDDDEFMPPKGDPLTPEEIELLSLWIQAGAGTEVTVADLGADPAIETTALAVAAGLGSDEEIIEVAAVTEVSVWDTLSPEEQDARMEAVEEAAAKYNFSVMPISAEDDRLRVNVINAAKEFGDDQLAMLEPVADRIVWLDLARSQVTDAGMDTVGRMGALERLHLENTQVTDDGIAKMRGLSRLEYLNLYGTGVGNGIFEPLGNLSSLKRLYVWQTNVDPGQARAFERSVNLEINTGVELAAMAAPAAEEKPAEPEKKEEAKPAEAPKKPEPKPAPKAEAKPAATPKTAPQQAAKAAPAKPPVEKAKQPAPEKAKAKQDAPPAKKAESKAADQPAEKAAPKPAKDANATPAPKPPAKAE